MKLIILAVVLLFAGVPNITDPDNGIVGIVCTIAGAAIIAYKIFASKESSDSESNSTYNSFQKYPASKYNDVRQIDRNAATKAPLMRDSDLISKGVFVDVKGNQFPIDSVFCVFDFAGLAHIDHNFYEITSVKNVQFAKAAIMSLNNCLNEAASIRKDLPPHRFSENKLKFRFDPYAGTRDYCTVFFENSSISKDPMHCQCHLSCRYSDNLSCEIVYDNNGSLLSAKVTMPCCTRIDYGDRIAMDADCYIVKMIPSHSGILELESVKTTREIERERQLKSEAWHVVHNKWQIVLDEHAKLLNEIGVAYTVANNLNLSDSLQMQHVIDLCKKDIALAESFVKAHLEFQNVRVANGWSEQKEISDALPNFPTFKRLAIIYEKQKKYDDAISVCQRAIELGFLNDGTEGQMPGRIARLMRKKGKSVKKIESADEVVIDDSTGEIIDS